MLAEIRGTTLYVDEAGSGAPLLLLHGGMGLDQTIFRPWLDPLAGAARLLFLDQRGQGRSSPLASFEGVTLDDWVEDVAAVADHLGLGRFVLLGHSVGGMVAQEFAHRHGERLSGLVLVSTAPVLDFADEMLAGFSRKASPGQLESVLRLFSQGPADDEELRRLSRDVVPLYLGKGDLALAERLISRVAFRAAANVHFGRTVVPTFDSRPWLGSVTVPALVVDGAEDVVFPVARAGARLAALLPGASHVVIEGGGHFPFAERQTAFLDALRSFLEARA